MAVKIKKNRPSKFFGQKINPKTFNKSQLPFFFVLIPFSILMLLPIIFIFNQAFKPQSELFAFPPRFFVRQPTFNNFIELLRLMNASGVPFSRYLLNSLFITVTGVVLAILFTSLSAYSLSKMKFKGKKLLFEINTLALMFVPVAVSIPRYIIIAKSGMIDTYFAHILPIITLPVAMFLVKQFIDQIPGDYIQAAKMDGATELQIFFQIVMPLIRPALATVGILAFQIVWNDTSTSTLFINSEVKRTLAFFLTTLTTQSNAVAGQGMAAAASLILFLPNLILFVIMQSRVMSTMAYSGIK